MILFNDTQVSSRRYDNGELICPCFTDMKPATHNRMMWTFGGAGELEMLLLAVMEARACGVGEDLELIMPYTPYSRCDREMPGLGFALHHFARIINSLHFRRVVVYDAHSAMTEKLLENCTNIAPSGLWKQAVKTYKPHYIFLPDAGAQKRYAKLVAELGEELPPILTGTKARDLSEGSEGRLLADSFSMGNTPEDLTGKRVLIADDLCCFGNTFVAFAEKLRRRGAELALCVTHLELAAFKGPLFSVGFFDKVFTTNSIDRQGPLEAQMTWDGRLVVLRHEC